MNKYNLNPEVQFIQLTISKDNKELGYINWGDICFRHKLEPLQHFPKDAIITATLNDKPIQFKTATVGELIEFLSKNSLNI